MNMMKRKSSVRKSSDMPLKEAIMEFLSMYHLEDKLNETKVIRSWEKAVGAVIAKHTIQLKIRKRVLFVKVDSGVVRNELLYSRKKLLQTLNRSAGAEVIDDIVFI